MKAKEAIVHLKELDPEDEILVDWISREVFSFRVVVDDKGTLRGPTEVEWQLALKDFDYDDFGLLDDYTVRVIEERLRKVFGEVANGEETLR